MFEIDVSRSFEAAHAIRLPDGSMEAVHRHTWGVRATVGSAQLDRLDVVLDFHMLEAMLGELVAQIEGCELNQFGPFENGRVMPTAERLAWWFAAELARQTPAGVRVLAVRVTEAPGCSATYRPADPGPPTP